MWRKNWQKKIESQLSRHKFFVQLNLIVQDHKYFIQFDHQKIMGVHVTERDLHDASYQDGSIRFFMI